MQQALHAQREFRKSRRLTPAEVREIARLEALKEAHRFVDGPQRHQNPNLPDGSI